jgi:hypothetical protein
MRGEARSELFVGPLPAPERGPAVQFLSRSGSHEVDEEK